MDKKNLNLSHNSKMPIQKELYPFKWQRVVPSPRVRERMSGDSSQKLTLLCPQGLQLQLTRNSTILTGAELTNSYSFGTVSATVTTSTIAYHCGCTCNSIQAFLPLREQFQTHTLEVKAYHFEKMKSSLLKRTKSANNFV